MEPSVNDIPDDELLGRAVRNCAHATKRPGAGRPRWSVVSDHFALGSTFSAQLCRRFGLDPEERVVSRRILRP